MKRSIILGASAALLVAAMNSHADTEEINSISHFVITDPGTPYETNTGGKGVYGQIMHATQIAADGTLSSQWCIGEVAAAEEGSGGSAGYCTIIFDNGDVLYTSYIGVGGGQPTAWKVMGGSGEYAGATGSGTSALVSVRADGEASTVRHTGTLTTK